MKVEILHERDSDGGCTHRVFVDGLELMPEQFAVEDVDPGRGWDAAEWAQGTQDVWAQTAYTMAFRLAVADTREALAGESEYIGDGPTEVTL